MARTRQQAKQRKAKRLEQERKQAERQQQPPDAATREALAEVEQAQKEAAAELSESQRVEVGAAREAARSAAAAEAATAAEASTTGKLAPAAESDGVSVKPSRRARRKAEAAREESGKADTRPRRGRQRSGRERATRERKEPRGRGRVFSFFVQVWAELRRVQWPNRNHVTQATAVVVVFCLIAGVYLGILDFLFNKLIKAIL